MVYQMEKLLTAYYAYASDTLSLSDANSRIWAVEYVWAIGEIRARFKKIQLELFAAGLSG